MLGSYLALFGLNAETGTGTAISERELSFKKHS